MLEELPSIGSLVLVVATPGGKCVCCLHVTGPWGQVCETVAGWCSELCLASNEPSVDLGSHLKGQCWVTKSQPVEPNVWGAGNVSQQLLSTNCMPGLELELATGLLGHRAQSFWLRLACPLCCLFGAQGPGRELGSGSQLSFTSCVTLGLSPSFSLHTSQQCRGHAELRWSSAIVIHWESQGVPAFGGASKVRWGVQRWSLNGPAQGSQRGSPEGPGSRGWT